MSDSNFSESQLMERWDSELCDTLGNLGQWSVDLPAALLCNPSCPVVRATAASLNPTRTYPSPPPTAELNADDRCFIDSIDGLHEKVEEQFTALKVRTHLWTRLLMIVGSDFAWVGQFSTGIQEIMTVLNRANQYFSANEPWKLKPSASDSPETGIHPFGQAQHMHNLLCFCFRLVFACGSKP